MVTIIREFIENKIHSVEVYSTDNIRSARRKMSELRHNAEKRLEHFSVHNETPNKFLLLSWNMNDCEKVKLIEETKLAVTDIEKQFNDMVSLHVKVNGIKPKLFVCKFTRKGDDKVLNGLFSVNVSGYGEVMSLKNYDELLDLTTYDNDIHIISIENIMAD